MTHPKTVWVTKYALSEGILEREVRESWAANGILYVRGFALMPFEIGADCARTRPEAVAIAEKMRAKKIASLEKQIARLKGLKFDE